VVPVALLFNSPPEDRRVTQLDPAALVGLVATGLVAGWLGALVGIGGGVLVVPALVLVFGVDIKVAVAASLVSVIATSVAAVSVYTGSGLTNMRLGLTLEVATALGAIIGSLVAVRTSAGVLSILFGVLALVTAVLMVRSRETDPGPRVKSPDGISGPHGWEERGRLAGGYRDLRTGATVTYQAERLEVGALVSMGAGMASGMLGIGGGIIKVPAIHLGMKVPMKVAAATSNFMVGVTAVTSVFIYLARGLVEPLLVAPLVLGVVFGALAGTRMSGRSSPLVLSRVLTVVLVAVAVEMLAKGAGIVR
jgi:uncharacterized membrane protein YfcA